MVQCRRPPIAGLKVAALAALTWCAVSAGAARADSLLVINGHIYTGNDKQLFAEAMAVKDGKITAVGSTADIQKQKQADSKVLDLGGKTVVPGFIDSHVHALWGSMALHGLNLYSPEKTIMPLRNPKEFVEAFKTYAAAHPTDKIIMGRASFNPQQTPPKGMLDQAVSDRPLIIHNTSEHSMWLNTKALQLAGITNKPVSNADEEQGIFRNPDGSPNGIVRELSMEIVERA